MTRLKAAAIHMSMSFFIVAIAITYMLLIWYPNGYFLIMGGIKLTIILACVDIMLGPLLTFIVFKPQKKLLQFDLACIALVQLVALIYGSYVIFESRPTFTVFNKDKFQISAVVDIAPEELAKAKNPKWKTFSITGPELVAIGTPDKNDRAETMFAMVESINAHRYPRLYEEYNKHLDEVIKVAKPLEKLYEYKLKNKKTVSEFIKAIDRPESDFLYLPIASELAEMSAIVDAKTGAFIQIVDAKQDTENSFKRP